MESKFHREIGPSAWRGLFDLQQQRETTDPQAFSLEARSTGRFVVARATAPNVTLVRSPATLRLCQLDACALVCVETLLVPDQDKPPQPTPLGHRLSILDFSRETQLPADPMSGSSHMRIAMAWFPRSEVVKDGSSGFDLAHQTIDGETSTTAAIVSHALLTMVSRAETIASAEIDLVAEAIVQLALKAFVPRKAPMSASQPLETVEAVQRYIDRNLGSPRLSPDSIATNFGLSRSTLYRLFEPLGGIAGYIRARRMQRVYAEITSPARANRRIGPAAFAVGFKNFSAFSRAFRETYGVTPAEARRNAIAGAAPTGDASNTGEISTLCRWVRDLRP